MFELTEALRAELQSMDTPTICNALEVVVPQRRGYGYTTSQLVCTRPGQKPMVGIARTATIRSAHPSDLGAQAAKDLSDAYYAYIDAGPKPSIVVLQDLDGARAGYGCVWGEVNSHVPRGLGARGVGTSGTTSVTPFYQPAGSR